jgi:hypothetical protein
VIGRLRGHREEKTVTIITVAQDATIQAIRGVLVELGERETRLRARNHALTHVRAHQFDQRIPVPPAVADVTPADAEREIAENERELAALTRQIDAEHGRLAVADVAAQATLAEAATPEYRRLVAARDRAQAVLDECERDIQMFLTDLRRRGVYQTPRIAEKA